MTSAHGSGPYEIWVLTLRAWAKDPNTSLEGLPVLDEETFSPETYARFFEHVRQAMQVAADRWLDALERVLGSATTHHDFAQQLLGLRAILARRVQLARHPSLAAPIREALEGGLRRDVERYQRELEAAVTKTPAAARVDSASTEKMLRVIREHSFLSVLDYRPVTAGGAATAVPLHERVTSTGVAGRSRSTRRVTPFPQS